MLTTYVSYQTFFFSNFYKHKFWSLEHAFAKTWIYFSHVEDAPKNLLWLEPKHEKLEIVYHVTNPHSSQNI